MYPTSAAYSPFFFGPAPTSARDVAVAQSQATAAKWNAAGQAAQAVGGLVGGLGSALIGAKAQKDLMKLQTKGAVKLGRSQGKLAEKQAALVNAQASLASAAARQYIPLAVVALGIVVVGGIALSRRKS